MSTSPSDRVMLVAYDGTKNADLAIKYAAKLLCPKRAIIATVWESARHEEIRLAAYSGVIPADVPLDQDELRKEAERINGQGVQVAIDCGLEVSQSLVELQTTVWEALVAAADHFDVDMIVCGTRGETGLRGLLHSSVAGHVLKHSSRPVFIVPPGCDSDFDELDAGHATAK